MNPLLLLHSLALGGPALAQEVEAPPVSTEQVRMVTFGDDMGVAGHLMLQGVTAYGTVSFTRPRGWELTSDPVLDLQFEHSGALLADQSNLTVHLNDQPVATIRLTEDNALDGLQEIRLPLELIEDHNRLSMVANQSYTQECEDPYDPALWTRISNQSSIRFVYEPIPIESELLDLPYPMLDVLAFGPAQIALVGPQEVSPGTLEAYANLGMALGREAAWRHVEVATAARALDGVNTHAIVLGTVSENPVVSDLVDTSSLKDGQGLVALVANPWNTSHGVLVITGKDDAGVLVAAQGVAANDRYDLLSGAAAFVDAVGDSSPPPTKQHPLPVPAGQESFTLEDLGIEDRTVRGYYAPTVSIPIRFEGDSHVGPSGGRIRLHYGYSAQLEGRLSTLEVRLNGVSLRSVALDNPGGSENEVIEIDVPADIIWPDSKLDVVFHLFPRDFDPCLYLSDKVIWGTLYHTSEIQVPRDHYALLPDLSKLRHRAWPFNLESPQAGVVVVVPNKPNQAHASAVMQLGAELGRLSVAKAPELRVRTADEETKAPSTGLNRILLLDDEPSDYYTRLVSSGLLTARSVEFTRQLSSGKELIQATVGTPYGTLEAARATGEDTHNLLVLRTPSASDLAPMVRLVFDETKVMDLQGNLAILEPGGDIETLDIAEKLPVGEVPIVSTARFTTRRHWLFVALFASLAAVIGTALVRRWAQARSGEV